MQTDHQAIPPEAPQARKTGGRDGLVIGMVLGFAVWLPFMLFSTRFLAQAVNALFAGVVVGLLLCATLGLGLYLFRKQIASHIFGDVKLSIVAVAEGASDAIDAWPDRNKATLALQRSVREATALASWFLTRRALVAVLLGMVGSVVAMVGTVLLLKQTQALEDQNRKLDAQTLLLERQNTILASEGLWELLWKVHYAPEPAIRLDAAVVLAAKGHMLRGVVLEGPAPPDGRFVHLREKPRYDDGAFDPEAPLVPIPARMNAAIGPQTFRALPPNVASQLDTSDVKNLDVTLVPEARAKGLRFSQSLVSFFGDKESRHTCPNCSFTASNVRVEAGQVHFEDVYFRDTQVWSGMGEISLLRINFDTLVARITWGRDSLRDCHGYGLVVDYHGWTGEMSRPTFDNCVIEHVLFRWDSREMSDVPAFLDRTVSSTARLENIYFVEEQGVGEGAKLVILRAPSAQADLWNEKRQSRSAISE